MKYLNIQSSLFKFNFDTIGQPFLGGVTTSITSSICPLISCLVSLPEAWNNLSQGQSSTVCCACFIKIESRKAKMTK